MLVKSLRATTPEYTVARFTELEGVFVAFVVEVVASTVEMFVAVLAIFVLGALHPMAFQSVVGTEVHAAIVADVVPWGSKRVLGIVVCSLVATFAVCVRHYCEA